VVVVRLHNYFRMMFIFLVVLVVVVRLQIYCGIMFVYVVVVVVVVARLQI